MPSFFEKMDKIKPAYDAMYKVVLFICKILLIADIAITSYSVIGRYVPFVSDPSWSEEVVLTLMSYMAVLSAALAIRRGAHIRMDALDRFLPTCEVFEYSIGYLRINPCSRNGSSGMEIRYGYWSKGLICKYAVAFQILDVRSDSACRNCNDCI